ncbi:MAG: pyridoxamine 5'-phosphate oxidase family protein [Tissierellia bacterium]|nr:pyridoxamine 5'-phosphate oxidase family protein [Tissierellia bacterium]MDD4725926.1 pyridoxamine 5'-phosphate oxidase family protein [Tissierellia bacterium]
MRRIDREMNKEFGLKVIDNSSYGIISMINQDNKPHCIPLSIAREDDILYFHSAMDGEKVNIFENNPDVCVTFVGNVNVPEIYSKEELDEILKDKSKANLLSSSVFTTEFESAIVKGNVKLLVEEEERVKGMRLICEKYTPKMMNYFNMAINAGLEKTNIYKIEIEEITAKRKKYNSKGQEMKWGKME